MREMKTNASDDDDDDDYRCTTYRYSSTQDHIECLYLFLVVICCILYVDVLFVYLEIMKTLSHLSKIDLLK